MWDLISQLTAFQTSNLAAMFECANGKMKDAYGLAKKRKAEGAPPRVRYLSFLRGQLILYSVTILQLVENSNKKIILHHGEIY